MDRGNITSDLAAAVPIVANWSLSSIPRAIGRDEVTRLLASIDRDTRVGSRPMRKWWRELALAGVVLFIISGIVGGPLGDIGSSITAWLWREPPKPLTVDFNDIQGCSQGRLVDLAKRQMNGIALTNGADTLIICDDQALQAVRSELPVPWRTGFLDVLVGAAGILADWFSPERATQFVPCPTASVSFAMV